MAFSSPPRSSPTLDHYLRRGSGSMSSRSQSSYARRPTKPKRFQSAHYDETTGTWRCKYCGYTYPNPDPHHHQRRAHKKICEGQVSKVHRWLTLSTGGTEYSQDSSNVIDQQATPETADSATSQLSLGQNDKQLLDREFRFHATPSGNEEQRRETEKLRDAKGSAYGGQILSNQPEIVASGEDSKTQGKEKLGWEHFSEMDLKPRNTDLARILTLNSDLSLPDDLSKADISELASSKFLPVSGDCATGSEGVEVYMEEPHLMSSQNEAHSLKAGVDVLTADGDALKERTEEVAQGNHPMPFSDENVEQAEDFGEGLDRRELNFTADDDTQDTKKAEVLQEVEESQMTPTEDGNAQKELRVEMGEGSGQTEAILPATDDDGALRKKVEEVGLEPGFSRMAENVVSSEDTSGKGSMPPLSHDEGGPPYSEEGLTSSQSDNLEDDSADKSAPPTLESRGGFVLKSDQNVGTEISFQPAGLEPDRTNKGVALRLSAAEANWDDWEDVIKSGPMLIKGITMRETEDRESSGEYQAPRVDFFGDVSGLGPEKTGTVLESELRVDSGIDTAPAAVLVVHNPETKNSDWLIDFNEPSAENSSGTANEEAISAPVASSPTPGTKVLDLLNLNEAGSSQEEGARFLDSIPVAPQSETGQSSKLLSNLSSALRNWEDWDHVIRGQEVEGLNH